MDFAHSNACCLLLDLRSQIRHVMLQEMAAPLLPPQDKLLQPLQYQGAQLQVCPLLVVRHGRSQIRLIGCMPHMPFSTIADGAQHAHVLSLSQAGA